MLNLNASVPKHLVIKEELIEGNGKHGPVVTFFKHVASIVKMLNWLIAFSYILEKWREYIR